MRRAKAPFFVQISDPQFGMWEPGADSYRETPLLAEAIARINALAPAFVVCTGDMIDLPGNQTQFIAARRQLGALDRRIPFYTVPGNHDVGDRPTPSALDWYRQRCGRDWYAFDHGGWHFVGLNSALLVDGSLVDEDVRAQWSWLETDLAQNAAQGNPAVVFLHHPPFLGTASEPDGYFNLPRAGRERMLELLQRHDITTVLAGHLHANNIATDAGVTVVANGPVGMPLRDAVSGLRIVRIGPAGLDHRYFALEEVVGQENYVRGG